MFKRFYNNALVQIFFGLLLVAFIMFISNYIVFRNSASAMYKQTRENNRLVAKSIISSFDECFKEVNDIIFTINMLPYQIHDTNGHENLNMHNTFLFVSSANKLIPQDYVQDFILYYPDSSLAITSQGTINFRYIFEQKYQNSQYASEFWKNFAVTKHAMKFIPAAIYRETAPMGDIYKRKLLGVVGNNMMRDSKINTLVFIDIYRLFKRVNQQNMMKGTSLVVLDQDKNVIISTDEDYDVSTIQGIYFKQGNEMTIQKGDFEYYCIKSDYNNFIYVNKIPCNYRDALSMMRVNQIVMAVTVFFAILLCAFLSLFLYKPIKKIINLIGNKSNGENQRSYSEIYNSIELIKSENQIFKTRMDTVENEVRRSIFFKLVDDITNYKKMKDQVDTYFKVAFFSKRFLMVAFHFEPDKIAEDDFSNDQSFFLPEDMAHTIEEVLNKGFDTSVVFYVENMMFIALLGINEIEKRDIILRTIQSKVEELKEKTTGRYIITAAVSKFYSEVQDCKSAFKDIKMCYAYRHLKITKPVIDAEKIDYMCDLFIPQESIEKLTNYIISGNCRESLKIINEIIDKNIENNINSIKFTNIINYVFNSIVNTLVFCGYNKTEITEIEKDFFEKANDISNYEEIRSFLNTIIKHVTENINIRNQGKLNKEFIIEYINLHYSEDLYLEKMADMLGTSPKYFSNFFKRVVGVNFVEYLNKIRVSHARELLRSSDMPVSEVGEKTGFMNSSTFTSTFKKYCGISPTEYRKEHRR